MWPDFMPGDPEIGGIGRRYERDDDKFDPFAEPPWFFIPRQDDYRERRWDPYRMSPTVAKGDKTKKDQKEDQTKKDEDEGKKASPKRGFWKGFIDPDGKKDNVSVSSAVEGGTVLVQGAGEISKIEAAAVKTPKSIIAALRSSRIATIISKKVGSINVGITAIEGIIDGKGITFGDGAKIVIAVIEVGGSWIIGLVDIGTGVVTGNTLSERIGAGIDNIKKD
jgi:hypothetical protein